MLKKVVFLTMLVLMGGGSVHADLPVTEGLIVDLRAEALADLADGEAVTLWPDAATEDAVDGSLMAVEGIQVPEYQSAAMYGRPVVRFNGAQFLNSAMFDRPDPSAGVTLMLVTTGDKTGAAHERLAHFGANPAPGGVSIAADISTNPGSSNGANGSGFRLNNGWALIGGPNPLTPNFHVGTWAASQGTLMGDLIYYLDGEQMTLGHNQPSRTVTFPDVNNVFALGNGWGPNGVYGGDYVTADVAVALVYNRVLEDAEIKELSEYLRLAYLAHDFAANPSPAVGTLLTETSVNLLWEPGEAAVSHNVYLGKDSASLPLLTEAMEPNVPVADLETGTTYYWRVDAVKADGTVTPSEVWSFSVAPSTAYAPVPADGSVNVTLDQLLSFTPGIGSLLHYVHFGTDADAVANAMNLIPQADPNLVPPALEPGTTYYWRVDEMSALGGTIPGAVWSFTTVPAITGEDGTLVGWWTMDENDSASVSVLDMSGQGNHGAISGDIAWVEGITGSAVEVGLSTTIATPGPGIVSNTVTLCGWFKPTIDHGRAGLIFMRAGGATSGVNLMNTNQLGYHWMDASDTWQYESGLALNKDEWNFAAMVVTPDDVTFYLNDVADANQVVRSNPPATFDSTVMLGWDTIGAGRRFVGAMDDLRFYNKALSVDEIAALIAVGTKED